MVWVNLTEKLEFILDYNLEGKGQIPVRCGFYSISWRLSKGFGWPLLLVLCLWEDFGGLFSLSFLECFILVLSLSVKLLKSVFLVSLFMAFCSLILTFLTLYMPTERNDIKKEMVYVC